MLIVALQRQSPLPARLGNAIKTLGKAQALVSFGTRGTLGRFANLTNEVVQQFGAKLSTREPLAKLASQTPSA